MKFVSFTVLFVFLMVQKCQLINSKCPELFVIIKETYLTRDKSFFIPVELTATDWQVLSRVNATIDKACVVELTNCSLSTHCNTYNIKKNIGIDEIITEPTGHNGEHTLMSPTPTVLAESVEEKNTTNHDTYISSTDSSFTTSATEEVTLATDGRHVSKGYFDPSSYSTTENISLATDPSATDQSTTEEITLFTHGHVSNDNIDPSSYSTTEEIYLVSDGNVLGTTNAISKGEERQEAMHEASLIIGIAAGIAVSAGLIYFAVYQIQTIIQSGTYVAANP